MYKIVALNRFEKDIKLLKKRKIDMGLISAVVSMLANGKKLDVKYKDHALTGNYEGCRECHVKPDLLLIYKKDKTKVILYLIRTGTHSDLF
jgi:addiction module toxin, RelE/StbE family